VAAGGLVDPGRRRDLRPGRLARADPALIARGSPTLAIAWEPARATAGQPRCYEVCSEEDAMGITAGSSVLVQWSDGNRYEGQVLQEQGDHVLVGFPNGQQHWIPRQFLSEAPSARPAPAAPSVQRIGDALEVAGGALEVQGGIKVYASPMEHWNELQQIIGYVESHRVPLGGIDPSNPITLWERHFAIDRATADGTPRAVAAQRLGFHDGDHFSLIQQYVEAKWSYLGVEGGQQAVLQHDEYTNSALRARMAETHQAQAAAATADPNLLAPVHGVSVEQWASASVALGGLGQGATPSQVAQVLAKVGLDKARYDAANAGWQAKMQGDTTGAIAQKFAEGFAAAQGSPMGGGGGEPCPFERYVEIMAAQGAWSEQGFDVNAKLREVFGIDAMEYSRFSSYWAPKMGTDIALMNRYVQLDAHYREKYAGQRMDDDLDL
jgi:hypothetical protein